MNSAGTGKKLKVYYIAVAIFFAWIIIPVFIKSLLYRSMDLFHAPIETLASNAGEIQDYWALRLRSKNKLIEDYRKLARNQALTQVQLAETNSNQDYINRLERLLAMNPTTNHKSSYARVIRRDINAWSETIKIDKGKKNGIKEGQAVIYQHGLVGRIQTVKSNTSTVTLISSPSFRITVNIANDNRAIAYSGVGQQFWKPLQGAARHIPQDILANDQQRLDLYTSGLGGHTPAGLFVGQLVSTEPELEGLFQKGMVRLQPKLRAIREVAVLIPLKQTN